MKKEKLFPIILFKNRLIIGLETLLNAGFNKDDTYICQVKNNRELIIKSKKDICIFCGSEHNLEKFKNQNLCPKCKSNLKIIAQKT